MIHGLACVLDIPEVTAVFIAYNDVAIVVERGREHTEERIHGRDGDVAFVAAGQISEDFFVEHAADDERTDASDIAHLSRDIMRCVRLYDESVARISIFLQEFDRNSGIFPATYAHQGALGARYIDGRMHRVRMRKVEPLAQVEIVAIREFTEALAIDRIPKCRLLAGELIGEADIRRAVELVVANTEHEVHIA